MGAEKTRGRVYIVGAGPADPGLITLAAINALTQADVVLHDALSAPVLLRHAPPDSLRINVGKRSGDHVMSQDRINGLLVEHGRTGNTVVRLKGGDPFVFGRGSEEALACKEAGVPYTIIPGVTSAIAAAAYAGIPLTHRGMARNFMVVTGQEATGASSIDWTCAAAVDTLVILMGAASLRANMDHLRAAGKDPSTPAACVRWGTRSDQQSVLGTVADIADRAENSGLTAPMVTVVGQVAALASDLNWFAPGPLAGKRIVVTRARAQASSLAAKLTEHGAHVLEMPSIRVTFLESNPTLAAALGSSPNWLVLTSTNSVDAVFSTLAAQSLDARALAGIRVAAIGQPTVDRLAKRGISADFIPTRATSQVLAQELPLVARDQVVFPCSSLTDRGLADAITARGGTVDQIVAYETTPELLEPAQLAELPDIDAIVFTSASSVTNFHAAAAGAGLNTAARLISIGERTSLALRRSFGRVDREAGEPSIASLVETTLRAFDADFREGIDVR